MKKSRKDVAKRAWFTGSIITLIHPNGREYGQVNVSKEDNKFSDINIDCHPLELHITEFERMYCKGNERPEIYINT